MFPASVRMPDEASIQVEPLVLRALAFLIARELNRDGKHIDEVGWKLFEELLEASKRRE